MTEAERLAQQASTELTSLINALRPPALERKSLPDAVREHVEEWSRQNYIEAKTNIDSTITMDEQVEQILFRVLQEALANVARHSKADKVNIELKSENDAVVLTIEDNRHWFRFEANRKRHWLGIFDAGTIDRRKWKSGCCE